MSMTDPVSSNDFRETPVDPAIVAGSINGAQSILSKPLSWLRWLSWSMCVLVVLALLLSINFEVFSRYLFDSPTLWVTEFSSYFLVAITFLGAAFCQLNGSHIRVTLLRDAVPANAAKLMDDSAQWLSVFVTLILLWRCSGFVSENYHSLTRSWSLIQTPLWIPQSTIVIGYSFLFLSLMSGLIQFQRTNRIRNIGIILSCAGITVFAGFLIADGFGLLETNLKGPQGLVLTASLVLFSAFLTSGFKKGVGLIILVAPLLGGFLILSDASLGYRAIGLISALVYLLAIGVPVVFTLGLLALLSIGTWLPPVSIIALGERTWEAVNTFELAAIPMFIMMGSLLVKSQASTEMYNATRTFFGRFRGALAHASIGASGIFAAVSGSSLATAAAMGRVAGSEMTDNGYRPELAYGVLAAGGTLGILIPPSIAMIVYGPMAGVPVTSLFLAGIIPGIALMVAFSVVVGIWVAIDPSAAPEGRAYSWREKIVALKGVGPFVLLIGCVLGSIYMGVATPTEAGGVGVIGAVLVSALKRTLSVRDFIGALEEAAVVTCFLLLIAVGAAQMSFVIDFLHMPQSLVSHLNALELSNLSIFVALVVLYVVLGMFVEPISMLLITLPVILPIVGAAGWDLMWFGIILVMLVEIGMITPPVGMILFVLSGVSENTVSLGKIAMGALPFVAAFLVMIALFYAFPQIVTWLPNRI